MAKGVFPREPRANPGDEALSPEAKERLEKKQHEEFLTERQLAYVAMTRAAKNLTIVCPQKSVYGRSAGPSPFVGEAGLHAGQNVAGKNDPTPEAPAPRTVFAHYFTLETADEDFRDPGYDRSEP
jgi:superfamily I DNA/RNA helicase